jgi:nucleoside recognition membrane protein YjiH
MKTAGIGEHFVVTYFVSFVLAFVMAAIISRIPPISRKPDTFSNGREQTQEERTEGRRKFGPDLVTTGINRATLRAHISGSMPRRIVRSVIDAFPVLPKVITLLCSIGILGMIVAKYTPVFDIIGYAFFPLTSLLGVPDAMVAAAAIPTGITEMFIPVLTIADQVAELHIKTRFFVTVVSMLQIIFLAESVVVIMNTGLPVKFRELMVVFLQRTIIAMPLAAIFMHILF